MPRQSIMSTYECINIGQQYPDSSADKQKQSTGMKTPSSLRCLLLLLNTKRQVFSLFLSSINQMNP